MTNLFSRRSELGAFALGSLGPGALGLREATAAPTGRLWQSERVRYDVKDRLVYTTDAEGNRIPDFSHAGYRNGDSPIPHVRTVLRVGPIEGDNTAHLQAALDEVGRRTPDSHGVRGALLLAPGNYPVAGTLRVNRSGVVLRGSGDGADPARNTVIQATGNTPVARDVVVLGGSTATGWRGEVAGTRTDITSEWVQVGSRSFEVADASGLKRGDNIILIHPCTEAWLASIDHGGTASDAGWTVDSQPITYNRFIRSIRGNTLTVDVPIFEHLRRERSQSYLYVWDRAGLVTNVGVESLRIDIQFAGDPDADEAHAWVGVKVRQVEDAWVRDGTFLHFAKAGVETTEAEGRSHAGHLQSRRLRHRPRLGGLALGRLELRHRDSRARRTEAADRAELCDRLSRSGHRGRAVPAARGVHRGSEPAGAGTAVAVPGAVSRPASDHVCID